MVKDKFPYFTNPSWPYFIALIQVLYFFKTIIYLLTAHQHLCDSAPLTIFPKFLNMEPIVRVQLQLKGMKFFLSFGLLHQLFCSVHIYSVKNLQNLKFNNNLLKSKWRESR